MNAYQVNKKSSNTTEEKHCAVIYLREVKEETKEAIKNITGYAVSTINAILRKADELLTKAKELFAYSREKVSSVISNISNVTYEVSNVIAKPCAYVIEFFYNDGSFAWLKIGKTDNILARVKQHLSKNEYGKYNVTKSVVKKLYYANDSDDALTIENTLRKHYKNFDNCGFIRNDRFTNCRFDSADLDNDEKIIAQLNLLAA